MKLFLPNGKAKYFSRKDWTAQLQNKPVGQIRPDPKRIQPFRHPYFSILLILEGEPPINLILV